MKRPYTDHEKTWKPRLTQHRRALCAAIMAVFEAQAGTASRIEALAAEYKRELARREHLNAVQAALREFDKRFALVRSHEQLRLAVD